MSIGNRIKLCDGLAKKGILGKRFFQKIYPKCEALTIGTDAFFTIKGGNINDEIHFGAEDTGEHSRTYTNSGLKAGDVLVLQAVEGCYGHDHHVDFEYQMSKVGTIYCQGFPSQWTDDNQNTNEFIRILTPLANGYYYTKSIAEHFGFPLSNENVGVYPHCRDW